MRLESRRAAALAILLLAAAATGGGARADTFVIDKEHTEVRFTWDHLGLSRQGGRFTDVAGTLEFDEARPEASRLGVIIKVASVWTGVAALDTQLARTREFFDAARYPTITFDSTAVRPTSARTAEVTGDLTINGLARPVVLTVSWNYSGGHPMAKINPAFTDLHVAGFSATTQIRRSDWGITRTIPYVSDEIQISIETELKRTAITAPLPIVTEDPAAPPAAPPPRTD